MADFISPPARPTASLPEDRDEVNARVFGDEFDTVPLPDQAEAMLIAPVCDASNMTFIRSNLPVPIRFDFEEFFERMAKYQWRAARPSAAALRRVPMGLHRPATGLDRSRPLNPVKPATDWKKIPELRRVSAYVFRGDKRRPTDIRAANGFHPPSSRTDDRYLKLIAERFVQYMKMRYSQDVNPDEVVGYIKGQGPAGRVFVEYECWRATLESEKFHIGRMVDDEFLRGYISTTRNMSTAACFARNPSADGYRAPVWAVYALHSEGGFLLPPRAQHVHGSKLNEAEVAHPGPIPWLKVMAFRTGMALDFDDKRTFYKSGVIFVRKGFRAADPRGCDQVIASLGKLGQI
jgi:hypothetical protein